MSGTLCENCGKKLKLSREHYVPSLDGTKDLRLCATCGRTAWRARVSAMREAKITSASTKPKRDLTGRNIRRWFVVDYADQRDGVDFWRCMCRSSLAEKVVSEREILDRKLNVMSEAPDNWKETSENPMGWIFGEWEVIGPAATPLTLCKKPGPFWKCRCICGTEREIAKDDLMWGPTVCCGCRSDKEVRSERNAKQNLARGGWNNRLRLDKNWTRTMERALRRFQQACVICCATDHLATHHVRPYSRGHELEPGNAVRVCRSCNSFIGIKEPGELPPDMALKLETAAAQFQEHWDSGCFTPAIATAAQAANIPKAIDPAFVTHLRSVESDEETAIIDLADWLEKNGDPRASAIREVSKIQAVVRETWIHFVLDGKRFSPLAFFMRFPEDTEDQLAQRVREVQSRVQSGEIWRRLGLTSTESGTLKQYLGIGNPMGVIATIEEISQRERKPEQTIRNRIDSALHHLTLPVPRVPGAPGGVWRTVVGDAPLHGSNPERLR